MLRSHDCVLSADDCVLPANNRVLSTDYDVLSADVHQLLRRRLVSRVLGRSRAHSPLGSAEHVCCCLSCNVELGLHRKLCTVLPVLLEWLGSELRSVVSELLSLLELPVV